MLDTTICCHPLSARISTFCNKTLTPYRNHVLGICDRILSRGYDLNIWAYARVKRKFGEGVVSHIQDMTPIRLRRKLLEEDIKRARAAAV